MPSSAIGAARNDAQPSCPRQRSRAHPRLRDDADGEPPARPRNRGKAATVAVAAFLVAVQFSQLVSLHGGVVTVATEAGLAPVAQMKESYDVKNIGRNNDGTNDTGYASNDTTVVKERKLESPSHLTYGGDVHRFERPCFKTNEPILGTPDYVRMRILNMGFPKVGSSSLQHMLQHSYNTKARHFHCGKVGYCGRCLRKSVARRNATEDGAASRKTNLLEECGNFTAFTRKYTRDLLMLHSLWFCLLYIFLPL